MDPKTDVLQSLDVVAERPAAQFRTVFDFLGRKRVHANVRHRLLHRPTKVDVNAAVDARRQPSLECTPR